MAHNVECTPCSGSGRHIARHKHGRYPGGQRGVQYSTGRLERPWWRRDRNRKPRGATWRAIRYRIKSQRCGRHTKTRNILRYLHDEPLRLRIQTQLNRGEARHGLARWLFFADQGEFRTSDFDMIMNKASCLSLLSNAVVLWNTLQIEHIVTELRASGTSALSGTDPDVLMKVDPLSAHVFAAISPDQPIFNLPEGNDCFVGLPGPFLRPDSPSAGRTAVNNGEGHRALAWRAASLRAG